jgi:hypothetical protein
VHSAKCLASGVMNVRGCCFRCPRVPFFFSLFESPVGGRRRRSLESSAAPLFLINPVAFVPVGQAEGRRATWNRRHVRNEWRRVLHGAALLQAIHARAPVRAHVSIPAMAPRSRHAPERSVTIVVQLGLVQSRGR